MSQCIFITGTSSGIGLGLAHHYLKMGFEVYSISRRSVDDLKEFSNHHHMRLDLNEIDEFTSVIPSFLKGVNKINKVILNAGILGKIQKISLATRDELDEIMQINLWSNKFLLDVLFSLKVPIQQVIAISSGAAVNGNKGWAGYSLSKAGLNMLVKLYAAEYPNTHFCSLAPGLVDTAMQEYICKEVDDEEFPSVKRIKSARNTELMPDPRKAANKLHLAIDLVMNHESGSFVDIRKMESFH